jgi:hypothetical protein
MRTDEMGMDQIVRLILEHLWDVEPVIEVIAV